MRIALVVAAAVAAIVLAPAAHADPGPGCYDASDPTCGGHSWNGPLRDTWDVPGYQGVPYQGPELCSPLTYQCGAAIPTQ